MDKSGVALIPQSVLVVPNEAKIRILSFTEKLFVSFQHHSNIRLHLHFNKNEFFQMNLLVDLNNIVTLISNYCKLFL